MSKTLGIDQCKGYDTDPDTMNGRKLLFSIKRDINEERLCYAIHGGRLYISHHAIIKKNGLHFKWNKCKRSFDMH